MSWGVRGAGRAQSLLPGVAESHVHLLAARTAGPSPVQVLSHPGRKVSPAEPWVPGPCCGLRLNLDFNAHHSQPQLSATAAALCENRAEPRE